MSHMTSAAENSASRNVLALMLCLLVASASTGLTMDGEPADAQDDQEAAEEILGLEVIVTDIRNDKGNIVVAVFNSANAFESYDYYRATEYGEIGADKAIDGMIKLSFRRLRSGPYAVSLFHDENNNDDFDMEGDYPLEGFGTSGARNALHEPTFEEASVDPGRVIIRMYYL